MKFTLIYLLSDTFTLLSSGWPWWHHTFLNATSENVQSPSFPQNIQANTTVSLHRQEERNDPIIEQPCTKRHHVSIPPWERHKDRHLLGNAWHQRDRTLLLLTRSLCDRSLIRMQSGDFGDGPSILRTWTDERLYAN